MMPYMYSCSLGRSGGGRKGQREVLTIDECVRLQTRVILKLLKHSNGLRHRYRHFKYRHWYMTQFLGFRTQAQAQTQVLAQVAL